MEMRAALNHIVAGRDLSQNEAAAVMEAIMGGTATSAQIAALLTALHLKGESDAEIAGMAEVMRAKATPVEFAGPVTDTCGTGGDGSHSFNISTAAALVAAGAGLVVAKHGNRAMSSRCGSADVLEGLGVKIDLDAAGVARCLREAGIGFMFAPQFHPAMRFVGPVRREIGIRTVFNLLGPLTNPARAQHQVLGVASAALAEKLARALSRMRTAHALVVHGDGGVDELSLSGPNLIFRVRGEQPPERIELHPNELGLAHAPSEALRGGDVTTNVAIVRAILQGNDTGPRRDVVLLNAAAALVAGHKAADFHEGLQLARQSLEAGHAQARLEQLVAVSQAGMERSVA
ncbi:MAG: anthranilate phosphoribosyltransferase [Candidatus Viridilinea halotolerans]|uniref:Anthranilate phosphoribosyltransferase n=1 Tax=Candidatus Viridilinea halotolerans TaxID=2491704 RepID=A0A426TRL4_9CHLR|nr:MAG: anthranilate phosphoribosyltransferase [Candidatus Viridilinea halotolerans]